MSLVEIDNACKRFGDFEVLKNISLTVETSEIVAIIGRSG